LIDFCDYDEMMKICCSYHPWKLCVIK